MPPSFDVAAGALVRAIANYAALFSPHRRPLRSFKQRCPLGATPPAGLFFAYGFRSPLTLPLLLGRYAPSAPLSSRLAGGALPSPFFLPLVVRLRVFGGLGAAGARAYPPRLSLRVPHRGARPPNPPENTSHEHAGLRLWALSWLAALRFTYSACPLAAAPNARHLCYALRCPCDYLPTFHLGGIEPPSMDGAILYVWRLPYLRLMAHGRPCARRFGVPAPPLLRRGVPAPAPLPRSLWSRPATVGGATGERWRACARPFFSADAPPALKGAFSLRS